ncbi:MAG: hypothetical protein Fur007_16120 [Rhodoferax sp.]
MSSTSLIQLPSELPNEHHPTRLIRDRCGVYYFRFVVPAALRQTVGKTELRRSLRTKDAALARQKALALSLAVEAITVDPKFLSHPTLGDFAHLLRSDANILARKVVAGGRLQSADRCHGAIECDHAFWQSSGDTMIPK